jgi:hypothetical protein
MRPADKAHSKDRESIGYLPLMMIPVYHFFYPTHQRGAVNVHPC